jgi:hypothetical protein
MQASHRRAEPPIGHALPLFRRPPAGARCHPGRARIYAGITRCG